MHDFEQRFGDMFRRVCESFWQDGVVKTTLVEGRYPINEKTCEVSMAPQPGEHPGYASQKFVVVEITYPPNYSVENRELSIAGPLPFTCAACLVSLGLGPLLHNSNTRDDTFVIFSPVQKDIYDRLPPPGDHLRI